MARSRDKLHPPQTRRIGAFGNLYLGESILAAMMLGCILIEFNKQVSSDGMSYYAVHRKTIPVLFLGLSIAIVFLLRAAKNFNIPGIGHSVSIALKVFVTAAIALLLTPYSVNNYFDTAHKTIGTTLFLWQLTLSLDWTLGRAREWISWFAILLEVAGGIAALLSLPHNSLGLQFQGQLLFQIGFFTLLNHVSKEIALSKDQPESA